jgi:dihydrofolate reductase
MGEFGEKMNEMPKFVVSTTLDRAEWRNSTIIGDDVTERVTELKAAHDGDILVAGSARLVRSLLAVDLVDELRLMVFPVVLGAGKRLFDDTASTASFELAETKQTGAVAILTLRRAAESTSP